jgi:hypothetical protein
MSCNVVVSLISMQHDVGVVMTDIGSPYAIYRVNPEQNILITDRSTGEVCHLAIVSTTKHSTFVSVREYQDSAFNWKCYSGIPGDCIGAFCPSALEEALVNPSIERGIVGERGKFIPEST